ncbi:hypothetical protein EDD18DRAFT_352745 [Armillaria luteobubalina]|uniref:Uncharacterized protein n=1 Tax=Armillaria luteobubalina TaxID=153913 RepID=A0AA39Q2N7_9AGAR|nr:hypothetical protein EDD18DRAFT_352745 [Armillaria luteobubalina]
MALDFLERLKVVRGRIPCLQSLVLRSCEILQAGRAELPGDIRGLFADAPRLRNVILHGAVYSHGNLIFPHHITHLATSDGTVSNLGAYQSPVECHLHIEYNRNISLHLHIFLPNVQRLLVPTFRMLANFCLPPLHDLTFTHSVSCVLGSIELAKDFLHRSQCSLTRLAIYSAYRDNRILIQDSLIHGHFSGPRGGPPSHWG